MRIRVTDWQYRNVRGLGNQSIDLGLPPKRWSLVQMPNGTGKTTTMELIRAVLSGQSLTADQVRGFRADDRVKDGSFEIGLLIDDVHYRLTLDLDFENGDHEYSTLRPKERGGGREHGRLLPIALKHLLKPNFTRLFVFDGELAKEIREVEKAEADRAIKTLYQLDELSALSHRIYDFVEKRQDAAASVSAAKSPKGLTQRRNALNEAKSVLSTLERKLSDLERRKTQLKQEADKAKAKIAAHIAENGDMKAEEEKIDAEARAIAIELQDSVNAAIGAFRLPTSLSLTIRSRLIHLGKTLTNARLPKSVSSEFFSELAEQDTCVCARPIGENERTAIYRGRDEYLAQDQIAAISTMKERLNSSAEPENSFQSACNTLSAQMEARKVNEWRRNKLIQSLTDADLGEVAALSDRVEQIKTELDDLDSAITKLTTTDAVRHKLLSCRPTNNIPLARRYADDCEQKLEVATNSYRLARQRDVLVSQLGRIEKRALEALRETIRTATNVRLKNLVQMEELQVSKIDGALTLKSDRVSEHRGVSEGQSLSVAYAFLTALLSEAPLQLPFIVDSPAVSLDLDVRREVGQIIPDLFDQMIMFVISSEQAGFADSFFDREDTCFVSLSKTPRGRIICEYGIEAFKTHAEEAPTQ